MVVSRRAARLRQEALDALEREYAANPDADEETIHIPGEEGSSSLLVMGYPSDTVYQLVSGPSEYHFVKLGWNGLSASSFEKMIPPGLDDAAIRARMEKGLSIPKSEVESIELTMKHCVSTQLPNDGIFTLRSGGKKRKFIVLRPDEPATPEALRAFFADVSGRLTVDTARYEKNEALREEIRELSEDPEPAPIPPGRRSCALALCSTWCRGSAMRSGAFSMCRIARWPRCRSCWRCSRAADASRCRVSAPINEASQAPEQ